MSADDLYVVINIKEKSARKESILSARFLSVYPTNVLNR